MAIDTGIAVDCSDLVEVGGVNNVYVTDLSNITTVTTDTGGGYSSLAGTADWAMFQTKPDTASFNVTSTIENGITQYEATISWYIPNITKNDLAQIKDMQGACIVAVAQFRSGLGSAGGANSTNRVVGMSEEYKGFGVSSNYLYNDTYGRMTVEFTSGTTFEDGNGATITITAPSYEPPRVYTGTISADSNNTAAALA